MQTRVAPSLGELEGTHTDALGRFIKGHAFNVGRLKGLFLVCQKCSKEFYVPQNKRESKYCSQECFKGHPGYNTGRTHFKKGMVPWNKGKKYKATWTVSEETKRKISEANKGQIPYIKGKTYKEVGRISKLKGENHPNWRGGTTKEAEKIRKSVEYKEWRKKVFERDKYTCQDCNVVGGELNADHIKPFSLFPELRTDINNGRTLCIACHKKTDTYLRKFKKNEREKQVVL